MTKNSASKLPKFNRRLRVRLLVSVAITSVHNYIIIVLDEKKKVIYINGIQR